MSRICNFFILASVTLAAACSNDDEPSEYCYRQSGIREWTVNGQPETPSYEYEPNIGGNLSVMYDLSTDGSFAVSIENDVYAITWGEPWELLFSGKEMVELTEKEWENELKVRGKYPVSFQHDINFRRQLWYTPNDSTLIILGDEEEEFLGGAVDMYTDKTSLQGCKFLVLDLTASYLNGADTITFRIVLDEPYTYPN